jgi:adenylylsulfate kinase-like enzyme
MIDAVGVSGAFISMEGFTDVAVERARQMCNQKAILLIDGDEVRAVVDRRINFDELLRRKRLHFDRCSDPYHHISLGLDTI